MKIFSENVLIKSGSRLLPLTGKRLECYLKIKVKYSIFVYFKYVKKNFGVISFKFAISFKLLKPVSISSALNTVHKLREDTCKRTNLFAYFTIMFGLSHTTPCGRRTKSTRLTWPTIVIKIPKRMRN